MITKIWKFSGFLVLLTSLLLGAAANLPANSEHSENLEDLPLISLTETITPTTIAPIEVNHTINITIEEPITKTEPATITEAIDAVHDVLQHVHNTTFRSSKTIPDNNFTQIQPDEMDQQTTIIQLREILNHGTPEPQIQIEVTAPVSPSAMPNTDSNQVVQKLDQPNENQENIQIQELNVNLEQNIRNSVKEDIQMETTFESTAFEALEDIPEPEVRKTFTDDILAVIHPQNMRNDENNGRIIGGAEEAVNLFRNLNDVKTNAGVTESSVDSTTELAEISTVVPLVMSAIKETDDSLSIDDDQNDDILESGLGAHVNFEKNETLVHDIQTVNKSNNNVESIITTTEFVVIDKYFDNELLEVVPISENQKHPEFIQDNVFVSDKKLELDNTRGARTFNSDELLIQSRNQIEEIEEILETDSTLDTAAVIEVQEPTHLAENDNRISHSDGASHVIQVNAENTDSLKIDKDIQEKLNGNNTAGKSNETDEEISSIEIAEDIKDKVKDAEIVTNATETISMEITETDQIIEQHNHKVLDDVIATTFPTELQLTQTESAKNINEETSVGHVAIDSVTTELPLLLDDTQTTTELSEQLESQTDLVLAEKKLEIMKTLNEEIVETENSAVEVNNMPSPGPVARKTDSSSFDSISSSSIESSSSLPDAQTTTLLMNAEPTEPISVSETTITVVRVPKPSSESSDSSESSEEKVMKKKMPKGLNLYDILRGTHPIIAPKGRALKQTNEHVPPQTMTATTESLSDHVTIKKDKSVLSTNLGHVSRQPRPELESNVADEQSYSHIPSLKILLPSDETTNMPPLIFETTTVLPLKILPETETETIIYDLTSSSKRTIMSEESLLDEIIKIDSASTAWTETIIEAAELTTEFTRHISSFRTPMEADAALPTETHEIITLLSGGESASNIGKALPNHSLKSESASTSAAIVILIGTTTIILIIGVLAVTFLRFRGKHGTLDIQLEEQRHGKDDNDTVSISQSHSQSQSQSQSHSHDNESNSVTQSLQSSTENDDHDESTVHHTNEISPLTLPSATNKHESN